MARPAVNRMGLVCLGLIIFTLVLAFPLRCFPLALGVALSAGTAGTALGAALALVTRTTSPLAIYLLLGAAALTFVPLAHPWPAADSFDVLAWRGAPDIVYGYFDGLRAAAFLLSIPFPFARLGRHTPDAQSAAEERSEDKPPAAH